MERGVQRKLHAPCEWGEKPEAESQGLTYPYGTSAGLLILAQCQNSHTAMTELPGFKRVASGRAGVIYQNRAA